MARGRNGGVVGAVLDESDVVDDDGVSRTTGGGGLIGRADGPINGVGTLPATFILFRADGGNPWGTSGDRRTPTLTGANRDGTGLRLP